MSIHTVVRLFVVVEPDAQPFGERRSILNLPVWALTIGPTEIGVMEHNATRGSHMTSDIGVKAERVPLALIAAVSDTVRRFLDYPAEQPMPLDRNLRDCGLTSMRAIELLLKLEAVFAVAFVDEQINQETFGSLERLAWTIHRLQQGEMT